jgi:hypothetical protein
MGQFLMFDFRNSPLRKRYDGLKVAGWLAGKPGGWLDGRMAGWPGWLAWLAGWLVSWEAWGCVGGLWCCSGWARASDWQQQLMRALVH